MKFYKVFWLFSLAITSTQLFAYGSSSSSKSCAKPQFSQFVPAEKSESAPQSAFSFIASSATNPKSIAVTIKRQAVATTITPANQGYQINGVLPNNLKGTPARIDISAETTSGCKGNGGWLIMISE